MKHNLQLIKVVLILILLFNYNFAKAQANAGDNQQGCKTTFTLDGNKPPPGSLGQWTVIFGSATFLNSSLYNSDATVGFGENILRWSFSGGGTPSSDDVTITNNLPSKAIAGQDQDICTNSTTVSANRPTNGTGSWSVITGDGEISNAICQGSICSASVSDLGAGINKILWTVGNTGCESTDEIIVANNKVEAIAGDDQEVCALNTVFAAIDPVVGSGKWTVLLGNGIVEYTNNNTSNVENLSFGNNIFRWTVKNSNCIDYDDVIITNDLPSKAVAQADKEICKSSTILTAERPIRGTGTWSTTSGNETFSDFTCEDFTCKILVSDISEGATIFKWTVKKNDCSSSDYVTVTFNETDVDFSVAPTSQTYPNATINIENLSNETYNYYLWDFGDGNTLLQTSFAHPTPYTYDTWGEYEVTLTAGEDDCKKTVSKTITILEATSGIEELLKDGIKIIPNPSNGIFNIVFENKALPDEIYITNMSGQKVYYNTKLNRTENIDISKSGSGIYIINIKKGIKVVKVKIVVDK